MFGYIAPDKPYLYIKDYMLYKSVYCGLCKSIKESYGHLPRFSTSHDSVFLSILLHNYLNKDYTIQRQNCILHPLKKRSVAVGELSKKVVSLNIMLAYHKFTDDIIDGEGAFKRLLRFIILRRAYRRAKSFMPRADEIIAREYERLRQLERQNERSIDRASDCFASMMEQLCRELLGERSCEDMERLFYNLGKWIYLIDALDDLDKDKKAHRYNPFIAAYGMEGDAGQFKLEHRDDLMFTFNCIYDAIERSFYNLKFNFNNDILNNILMHGIRSRTKMIMENCKCTKIRI